MSYHTITAPGALSAPTGSSQFLQHLAEIADGELAADVPPEATDTPAAGEETGAAASGAE